MDMATNFLVKKIMEIIMEDLEELALGEGAVDDEVSTSFFTQCSEAYAFHAEFSGQEELAVALAAFEEFLQEIGCLKPGQDYSI